jgi:radical SAM superfamily enzyme YgiQ (UPF0313 family)
MMGSICENPDAPSHKKEKKVRISLVKRPPHILLIDPWITDFAAYNLWVRPLGLLSLAGLLRRHGFHVTLIDCLGHPVSQKKHGDGKFLRTIIEKPEPLRCFPRYYNRYGITEEAFIGALSSVERPAAIGITSAMTYWYPGVFRAIELARQFFEGVPIVLGGIYATLCYDHAKQYSGADVVFKGGRDDGILDTFSRLTGSDCQSRGFGFSEVHDSQSAFRNHPYPAFDLYPRLDSVCVATSRGCPLRCTYCASRFLTEDYSRRDPGQVAEEIEYWVGRHGVKNIAFYDDALLIDAEKHIIPILRELIKKEIRCNFHTPNGLHVRELDGELAALLYRAGFKTIRLGFETSSETLQIETGGKVDNSAFQRSVENLKKAGYAGEEIGVYIMAGLPGQRASEAEESIAFVEEAGARPMLVEYSPIPMTSLFEKAKQHSSLDLENEPLFHNNSILPCRWEGFTFEDYRRLKEKIRRR